jgi:hypothetical protein
MKKGALARCSETDGLRRTLNPCVRLACLLACLTQGSSLASEQRELFPFRVLWRIEPQPVPPQPVSAGRYSAIAEARLLPAGLFNLREAVRDTNGIELLAAGTQLVALDSPKIVGCTMTIPAIARTMKPKSSFWSKDNRYLCMIDNDKDGSFEGFFWLYTHLLGSLQGEAFLPPVEGSISLTSYASENVAKAINVPKLKLLYVGGSRFIASPRTDDSDAPLLASAGPPFAPTSKGIPSRFYAFGGEFELLSKVNGQAVVRTIKSFDPEPFSIHR